MSSFSSWAVLASFVLSVVFIIFSPEVTIFKRKVAIDFGVGPPLVLVALLVTTIVPFETLQQGIIGDENIRPWQILVLFFSLAYVCISLDLTGVFEATAIWAAQKAGNHPLRLFVAFFALASALTVVTSNDIVILTLTPIIIECCKKLSLDPWPLLVGQFMAANTLSVALIIGNPTNLIIAGAQNISFAEYLRCMILPAVVAAASCFVALYLYYRKALGASSSHPPAGSCEGQPQSHSVSAAATSPWSAVKDRRSAIFGILVLSVVLLLLAVGPYLDLSMATVTAAAGILMLVKDLALDTKQSGGFLTMLKAQWRGHPHPPAAPAQPALLVADAVSPPPAVVPFGSDAVSAASGSSTAVAFAPVFMPASALSPNAAEGESDQAPVLSPPPASPPPPPPTMASQQPTLLVRSVLDRMPWKLLPFVVAMFSLVAALSASGWVSLLASFLASATAGSSPVVASVFMLVVSSLACNVLNNQPMSVLFSRAVLEPTFINAFVPSLANKAAPYSTATLEAVRELPVFKACIYSLVAGSNFGANITLIGALAGVMWKAVAQSKGLAISGLQFTKVGCVVMVPVVLLTAVAIGLEF